MKIVTFVLVLLLCSTCLKAQGLYDRNWYFGNRAALQFNDTNVTVLYNSAMKTVVGAACISDSLGNLLFYTNGQYIWNKDHEEMQNDDSLYGYPIRFDFNAAWVDSFGSSTTNGLVIVPVPLSSSQYYVLAVLNNCLSVDCLNALVYHKVDLNLDGGLGGVVVKNVFLDSAQRKLCEKLSVVRHANGRDWWLLSHERENNNFISWLITPDEIQGPWVQSVGSPHFYHQGEMFVSLDGNRLACLNPSGLVDVFTFDRCTGQLSFEHEIGSPPYDVATDTARNYYGGAFSTSGNILYFATKDTIYQVDITLSNPARQIVWINPYPDTSAVGNSSYYIEQFELGPEGKVYVAYTGSVSNTDTSYYYLSCINQPELDAANCDFVVKQINLNPRRCWASLPNMPNYNLGALVGSNCDTLTSTTTLSKSTLNFSIYPNPTTKSVQLNATGITSETTIEILNPLGQIVYRYKLSPQNNSIHQAVDVSSLPSGIYVVILQTNDNRFIQKVVKQ